MYCPICQKKNIEGAKFCFACGIPLSGNNETRINGNQQNYGNQQGPGRIYKNNNQSHAPGFERNLTPAGKHSPHSHPGMAGLKTYISRKGLVIIAVTLAAVLTITLIATPSRAPKNAMAALYDGVKNLLASEGFDLASKGRFGFDDKSYEFAYDLSILFGEDVKSTIYDISYTPSIPSFNMLGFGFIGPLDLLGLEDFSDVSDFPSNYTRQIYTGDYVIKGTNWGGLKKLGAGFTNRMNRLLAFIAGKMKTTEQATNCRIIYKEQTIGF